MTCWVILVIIPLFLFTGCRGISRSLLNSLWRARWQQPESMIRALAVWPDAYVARYLRPDGRIVVIDLAGTGWLFKWLGHWTPKETIRKEMGEAGYQRVKDFEFFSRQNFQVFERKL